MVDFAAIAAKAAAEGANQTVANTGGGDYKPLAAGPCRLRFVGYIELGKVTGSYQGKPKVKNRVWLLFEVSGPKHPPREFDGVKYPNIITCKENLSLSDKANFFKLFTRMNYAGKAQHMAQLLGEAYKGEIFHREWKGEGGAVRVEAELRNKDGYSIQPPRVEDPETGDYVQLTVAPALAPTRCLIWDYADKDQWASIYIDGEYAAKTDKDGKVIAPAKSKNIYQAAAMQAENFEGSVLQQMLIANGASLDIPDVDNAEGEEDAPAPQQPAASKAPAGDPLAGIA
jgi:hypothetical protein